MTRDDKLRQAISLWKAIQNWTWKRDHGAGAVITHDLRYSFDAIDHLQRQLQHEEREWQAWFAEAGIEPFAVVYEDFAKRYEETAADILAFLRVDVPPSFGQRRMTRQSDDLTELWVERYLREAARGHGQTVGIDDRLTPPNILYLHSHDTGRYVQPYGYAVPTPRIQGLAEEGVLFRQAFCAASTCSASRACLLTGQYAHSNGMLGLAHRGWSLNDYPAPHRAHTVATPVYHSVLIGEQHISKRPDIIGLRPGDQDRHHSRRRRGSGDGRSPARPRRSRRGSCRSASSRRTASSSSHSATTSTTCGRPQICPTCPRRAADMAAFVAQRALARPRSGHGAGRARPPTGTRPTPW
jgi:hypothetical protein